MLGWYWAYTRRACRLRPREACARLDMHCGIPSKPGRGHDEETAAERHTQGRPCTDVGVAHGGHGGRTHGGGVRIVVAGPRALGVERPKRGGIRAGQCAGVLRHTTGERGAHGLRQPRPAGQRQRHRDRELGKRRTAFRHTRLSGQRPEHRGTAYGDAPVPRPQGGGQGRGRPLVERRARQIGV